MSELLRYEMITQHREEFRGRATGTPFSFALYMGNGADQVYPSINDSEGNSTGSIEVDGGWLEPFANMLTELVALRAESDKRLFNAIRADAS